MLVFGCIAVLMWVGSHGGPAHAHHYFFPLVRDRIKQQMEAEIHQKGFTCQGEIICGLQAIPVFYQGRDYAPIWFGIDGLRPAASTLVDALRHADREGLNPYEYHLEVIERLLERVSAETFPPEHDLSNEWADLDLMLTDAYLLLGAHLSGGRINPENLHSDWLLGHRSLEMVDLLRTTDSPEKMTALLKQLRPRHHGYEALVAALRQLRAIAAQGGWPTIQTAHTLKPGDQDAGIVTIRQRLILSDDLPAEPAAEKPEQYDPALLSAVERFQRRHGLKPDGAIGPKTRAAMNVTVESRIRQIELNLERWRWLPQDLGERYIAVNTAAFYLKVVEQGREKLAMKVVVGRPARRSPVFSAAMTYMVFNPYWNVPHKLAVEDILPKVKKGVDYLTHQKIKVFSGWDEETPELDPQTIQWSEYGKHRFPFRLRQEPGEKNALGKIKFMFPNKFAVYLHDTPQKSLFAKSQRGLSSGCIRVEDAQALAAYLLFDDPDWTPELLLAAMETGKRRVVHVPRPIPIHLHYMTAWVDPDGTRQFRKDIYKRDRMLDRALKNRAPYPLPPLTASR